MDNLALVEECHKAFLAIQRPRKNWSGLKFNGPHYCVAHNYRIFKTTAGQIVSGVRRDKYNNENVRRAGHEIENLTLLGAGDVNFSRIAANVKFLREAKSETPRKIISGVGACAVIKKLHPSFDCKAETIIAMCVANIAVWNDLVDACPIVYAGGRYALWSRLEDIGFVFPPPNPGAILPRFTARGCKTYFCAHCQRFVSARRFAYHVDCYTRMFAA
jgi:hypothetical protein